tara:strand:- start:245 stop:1048 length:804 start_codon:yes stop_codon:yes gene_type:complete
LLYNFIYKFFIFFLKKERIVNYYDVKIVIDLRDYLFSRRVFLNGSFNKPVEDFILKQVHRGMNVIDAGANIGAYSMMMSRLVTNSGKVIAFEPDKRNISLFKKSIKTNSFKNIILHEQLLSDINGEKEIYLDQNYYGSSSIISDDLPTKIYKKQIVSSTSLDQILYRENIKIDLIKVNIEGSELKFIKGAKKTIEKHKPKILIEYYYERLSKLEDYDNDNFLNYFRELGYEINPLGYASVKYSNNDLKNLSISRQESKLGTLHLYIS